MRIEYRDVLRRLREERERNKWSQEKLGKKLYISQSHYGKAEMGLRRLTYKELHCLSQCGLDTHYIYSGNRIEKENYREFFTGCEKREIECLAGILFAIAEYSFRTEGRSCFKRATTEKELRDYLGYLRVMRYVIASYDGEKSIWLLLRMYLGNNKNEMAAKLDMDIKTYRSLEEESSWPDSERILIVSEFFHFPPFMLVDYHNELACQMCDVLENFDAASADRLFAYLKQGSECILRKKRGSD